MKQILSTEQCENVLITNGHSLKSHTFMHTPWWLLCGNNGRASATETLRLQSLKYLRFRNNFTERVG